jgi:3alpha(or 20beta)-hydroxysteroid dehydrogenase
VVVSDLNEGSGWDTVELAGRDRATFVRADTTSPEDTNQLVRTAVERFEYVSVLHNNAAILQHFERIEDIPVEEFRRVIDVNLVGVFLMAKAVVPVMRGRGTGVIVNMSSAGAVGVASALAYSSAKAGVIAFTRGLAAQLAPTNIRVNALLPGLVETPMTIGGPHLANAKLSGGPYLRAEDVARSVVYAAEKDDETGAILQYTPTSAGPRLDRLVGYEWQSSAT